MSFTKILCPIDFSPGSQQAMRLAIQVAKDSNAELVLFHSWYLPPLAFTSEMPFPAGVVEDLVGESERGLEAAVQEAIAAGATHTTKVLANGLPWMQIVSALEKQAFDLCVIGTHGRTGLSRILLGSVAEKVIRHAPCSVLAVRPGSKIGAFGHILVPTDFSDSAMQALDLAGSIVRPDGSITLLHVLELPVAWAGPITDDFARDLDKRSAVALEASAQRIKSVRVVGTSRIGYPGVQTLSAIDQDRTIDLVVMGSHGRTGIKRALLGSVAEKVVRNAHCSVLIARKRG